MGLRFLQKQRPVIRLIVLAAVVLAVHAIAAPWIIGYAGSRGFQAATLVAGLCLAGGIGGLVVSERLRDPRQALLALLLSMFLRTAVPLIGVGIIHLSGGPLAQAGLVYYLLVYYPFTLATATVLSLPSENRPPQSTPA